MLMATRARTLILMLTACLALYATRSEAQTTLKVSAIPDEAPTELQRKFVPFGKYLEANIGMPVEFIPVTARIRTNGTAIPLVQRAEDEKFQSVFITQPNSGINSLADLKGKTFTFGSQSSTSGHLMPRWFLLQNGIDPDKDFRRMAFSGAHDATALQVAGGKVDAGAMNISVWNKMLEEKKLDPSQVRVFYTTPPYYDYNWTVRGDLDPALVQRLKDAFLALDPRQPAHKEILDLQRASKFIPTTPENYQGIEQAARSAGLLK